MIWNQGKPLASLYLPWMNDSSQNNYFVKKFTRGEHNFHSSVRGKRDGIELVYAYIREDD